MMRRALVVMVFALLAAEAHADMPAGPWPWSKRASPSINRFNYPPPNPDPAPSGAEPAPPQPPNDPKTGLPMWEHKPDPPKRNGPFRSCGSGMGIGLAGIGAAWAMLWLGMRFVRVSRSPAARG